jgi:hypothetical protein
MRPVLCITTSKTKKACGVFTAGLLKSRAAEQENLESCLAGIEEHSFVQPPCI